MQRQKQNQAATLVEYERKHEPRLVTPILDSIVRDASSPLLNKVVDQQEENQRIIDELDYQSREVLEAVGELEMCAACNKWRVGGGCQPSGRVVRR